LIWQPIRELMFWNHLGRQNAFFVRIFPFSKPQKHLFILLGF
jgi:hypothetical protein